MVTSITIGTQRALIKSMYMETFVTLLNKLSSPVALLFLSGCVAYGEIDNELLTASAELPGYSLEASMRREASSDTIVLLAFSGGGTRAAALSYGVLKELRDTSVKLANGETRRLLDDVQSISAVSGGSFTAAYYGLHGERTFDSFENAFLKSDFSGAFWLGVFNPLRWFSHLGRTDRAVNYFDEKLFNGATFDDFNKQELPLIIINATDLGSGVRFSFLQDYFNLLCSDLSSFRIAKAVTASSAVPIMFHPVALQRYNECDQHGDSLAQQQSQIQSTHDTKERDEGQGREFELVLEKLVEFEKPREEASFVHLVDGGITDNLGLRAIYDVLALSGGGKAFLELFDKQPPRRIVLISVNAAIDQPIEMNSTNRRPAVEQTVMAMSTIQFERYNAATLDLVNNGFRRWTADLATPEHPVDFYFIPISFNDVVDESLQLELNSIPTSYSLTEKQIDTLVSFGSNSLKAHEVFQTLMNDM